MSLLLSFFGTVLGHALKCRLPEQGRNEADRTTNPKILFGGRAPCACNGPTWASTSQGRVRRRLDSPPFRPAGVRIRDDALRSNASLDARASRSVRVPGAFLFASSRISCSAGVNFAPFTVAELGNAA